ncbi:dihydroneopterin aldolase [Niallia sp. 01092]|uniref:dihydroneopterin aldolase n=1 Tax=unclassified Niallia TaxID=2837522 RepID=UPI003FD11CF0
MDKIRLTKMEFYGYHGVFPEETKLGQRFIIDLEVEADLREAGESDNLEHSVNYGQLYFDVKEIVEGKPYQLIEALAENIAQKLLHNHERLESVRVAVIKPDPPIPGHYQSVSVEILRKK